MTGTTFPDGQGEGEAWKNASGGVLVALHRVEATHVLAGAFESSGREAPASQ